MVQSMMSATKKKSPLKGKEIDVDGSAGVDGEGIAEGEGEEERRREGREEGGREERGVSGLGRGERDSAEKRKNTTSMQREVEGWTMEELCEELDKVCVEVYTLGKRQEVHTLQHAAPALAEVWTDAKNGMVLGYIYTTTTTTTLLLECE